MLNTKNKNNQIKFIHFSLNDFTINNFTNIIINHFKLNITYSLLIKISSLNNLEFKMCGHQIGLVIGDKHDLEHYKKIFQLINTKIETTLELYNYLDSIDSLEISYFVITPQVNLTLKNIMPSVSFIKTGIFIIICSEIKL